MNKRIISVFLALVMCICTVQAAIGAEGAEPIETTGSVTYSRNVQAALDLGLLTLNGKDENELIQRRDIAEIVVKARGFGSFGPLDTVFNDVAKSEEKSGYIAEAYKLKILNGYFDGSFRPYLAITYDEVIKTLVCTAGYEPYAEVRGGYPVGYHLIARDMGILIKSYTGTDKVTIKDFCDMLICTLEADMLDYRGITDGDASFESVSGRNILTEYLDMEIVEGRITANHLTGVTAASSLEKGYVELNGKQYFTKLTDLENSLGKYVVCYVTTEGKKEILAFRNMYDDAKELTVDINDADFNGGKLSYYADGREIKVNYLTSGDLIYNGVAKAAWSDSDFDFQNGYVRLLDTDNNGTYDLIFAYSFKNLIVKNYVSEDFELYFNTADAAYKNVSLDEIDGVKYQLTDKDGKTVDPSSISGWSIISAAKSLDGRVWVMRYSNDTVEGTISDMGQDEVTIDGTSYMVDKTMDTTVKEGMLEIGKAGIFYFDYSGKLAAVNYDTLPIRNYAYLTGLAETTGLGKNVRIKLFTADGTFKEFTLAEKIKLNGTAVKDTDVLLNTNLISRGNVVGQMVTYEANADGVLRELDYAVDGSLLPDNERETQFNLTETCEANDIKYRTGNLQTIASKYFLTENTVIFAIPDDINAEEDFYVLTRDTLGSETVYPLVKLYDVDRNHKVSLMQIKYTEDLFEKDYISVGVVMGMTNVVDADGDNAYSLKLRYGGSDLTITVKDNFEMTADSAGASIVDYNKETPGFIKRTEGTTHYIDVNKLQIGDVVQYKRDNKGMATGLHLIYRRGSETNKEIIKTTAGISSATKYNGYGISSYLLGDVSKLLDNAILVDVPSSDGLETYQRALPLFKSTDVLRWNEERGIMETLTFGQIKETDKVFVSCRYANVFLILVQ